MSPPRFITLHPTDESPFRIVALDAIAQVELVQSRKVQSPVPDRACPWMVIARGPGIGVVDIFVGGPTPGSEDGYVDAYDAFAAIEALLGSFSFDGSQEDGRSLRATVKEYQTTNGGETA